MARFLEDTKGNKSSKRLWGSILLGYGALLSLILFAIALKNHDYKICIEIIVMIICMGAALIGINFIPDTWGKSGK